MCVCLSVCLLSHISLLEHLFVLKILSRTQRATEVKNFVGFSQFETASFKSYGVKRRRKSQLLIRSSLLWLILDQVFLFAKHQRLLREGVQACVLLMVKAIALPAANPEFQSHVPSSIRARALWIRARADAEGYAL